MHKIYSVSKLALQLVAYRELPAFKLYHNDIGLLGAMSKLNAKTIIKNSSIFTEFKGALTKQLVFQQLKLNEDLSIHYFPFDNSKYEVDFVIKNAEDEIIPIEVKAGENLRTKSFKLFCEKFHPEKAIHTSLSNYRMENWMTNVPLYIVGNYY